ncbi:uncharacterized protein LOC129919848 isoform X2 [Episyrphus balteatus]|uniref:uncharacterized protein LOC129919848 isoform X2 n=1 Tax=Episyrphus balteatus TaxID=286459 RepID=UPI002486BDDB|nr:uncharacterized protein LOC129919848 isoform X2 [Episyrphus balteatus]
MQNPIENPTSTYEYEMKPIKKPVLHHHHPSKTFKNIYRTSHYKSYKYADIGFTITKQNKKYVAHCRICNRTLGNTAYARLKGHRNICRETPMEDNNGTECPPYPVTSNETFITKQNDSLSQNCISQASDDNSRLTFNVTPKIESVDCQLSPNLHPYDNSDQESQLLNEDNQLKLNMIEVLLPIKYNKKLLLLTENTKKSVDMWMDILKKAQSLGLAPTGVPWTYARDSLYSVWRHHTLQKKGAIESGETNVKYNIVDLTIWQIENEPMSTEDSTFDLNNLYETANNSMGDKETTENTNSTKMNWNGETNTTIATQTEDEMYKADLRLKLLQCESMEIENYKRSLETLELERKLQIPNSKFSAKYFPTTQIHSNQTNDRANRRWYEETNNDNMVKIELDD